MRLDRLLMVFLALIILTTVNARAVNAQNQKTNEKDKRVQKDKDANDDENKLNRLRLR